MSRRKRLTNKERCDIYRFLDAFAVIVDAEVNQGMTSKEIAFLVGVDVDYIRQFGQMEECAERAGDFEAVADRLTKITAHDRLRLAAFRAKTEQIQSTSDPTTDQPAG